MGAIHSSIAVLYFKAGLFCPVLQEQQLKHRERLIGLQKNDRVKLKTSKN